MTETENLPKLVRGCVEEFSLQLDDPVPEYAVLNYFEEAEGKRRQAKQAIDELVASGELERTIDDRLLLPKHNGTLTGEQ